MVTATVAMQRERSIFSYFDRRKLNKKMLTAAEEGQDIRLRVALDSGAEIDYVDELGQNALHKACRGGHVDCMKLLIARGADLVAPDNQRQTRLLLAVTKRHQEAIKALIENAACLHLESLPEQTPGTVDWPDPLGVAISANDTEIV